MKRVKESGTKVMQPKSVPADLHPGPLQKRVGDTTAEMEIPWAIENGTASVEMGTHPATSIEKRLTLLFDQLVPLYQQFREDHDTYWTDYRFSHRKFNDVRKEVITLLNPNVSCDNVLSQTQQYHYNNFHELTDPKAICLAVMCRKMLSGITLEQIETVEQHANKIQDFHLKRDLVNALDVATHVIRFQQQPDWQEKGTSTRYEDDGETSISVDTLTTYQRDQPDDAAVWHCDRIGADSFKTNFFKPVFSLHTKPFFMVTTLPNKENAHEIASPGPSSLDMN